MNIFKLDIQNIDLLILLLIGLNEFVIFAFAVLKLLLQIFALLFFFRVRRVQHLDLIGQHRYHVLQLLNFFLEPSRVLNLNVELVYLLAENLDLAIFLIELARLVLDLGRQ